ncbi:MAG: 2-amino-3-ketobutyrate coenzyme A ligase [Chlamydiales bacterium]|nr:2-amino-3-ketobutyrate coenzyme A ligase [Chlamydiales bacterium]MCH9620177.1 2-amino-3-ketobutyrate coenzyme A ligase [Chlamydiales bacterium]MCH9623108.1 2-amino-3-ketobutyrate coenzyme A ligase [Chlamydiales bacterium]
MNKSFITHLDNEIEQLKENGLYKSERIILSPQQSEVSLKGQEHVLNFCSNNYLGLANHPRVVEAAKSSYKKHGFGLASVRFICGTQDVHIELEKKISSFLGSEETILYSSCFDANGGLFETLLGPEDAVISDALNHASIIDGIRLCKAKRLRFRNNDMAHLEEQLKEAQDCRFRLIATDGVFSMDGIIANLEAVCDLADKYDAIVMIDDCHAAGFLGENGRGTHEYCKVLDRVDIITGTLGKALGGASGGFTSGRAQIISWLRQRSRPYLFSNTLAPSIATASIEVLNILEEEGAALRAQLFDNANHFRKKMTTLGFTLAGKDHPIIPVMIGDAKLTQVFAKKMLEEGIYVVGFFYPVVPQGAARIRTQMSAVHTKEDVDRAIAAFEKVGKELNVI